MKALSLEGTSFTMSSPLVGKPTLQVSRLEKSNIPAGATFFPPECDAFTTKQVIHQAINCKWNQVPIGLFSPLLLHRMRTASKIYIAIICPSHSTIYIFFSCRHFIFVNCAKFYFDSSPEPSVKTTFHLLILKVSLIFQAMPHTQAQMYSPDIHSQWRLIVI